MHGWVAFVFPLKLTVVHLVYYSHNDSRVDIKLNRLLRYTTKITSYREIQQMYLRDRSMLSNGFSMVHGFNEGHIIHDILNIRRKDPYICCTSFSCYHSGSILIPLIELLNGVVEYVLMSQCNQVHVSLCLKCFNHIMRFAFAYTFLIFPHGSLFNIRYLQHSVNPDLPDQKLISNQWV